MSSELEAIVEQKSREEWNQNNDTFRKELSSDEGRVESREESNEDIVDFVDENEENDDVQE